MYRSTIAALGVDSGEHFGVGHGPLQVEHRQTVASDPYGPDAGRRLKKHPVGRNGQEHLPGSVNQSLPQLLRQYEPPLLVDPYTKYLRW